MRDIISTYAPGVKEIFAAVDVAEQTKAVEFESKLFSSKAPLTGLKEQLHNLEQSADQEGMGIEC